MSLEADLLGAFEIHSPDAIRAVLDSGIDVHALIKGKSPVDWLIEMYARSAQFSDCLRVLLDAGASVGDPLLEALLLDDVSALRGVLAADPGSVNRRFHLACAFTSLKDVSGLHVCAEYNSTNCARALIDAGIGVNVRSGFDADGLGGHTPLFHTVNSRRNYCRPVMELLVDSGADLDVRLKGLVWGGGFEWETVILDVSPISYAQCGLYFQFHRVEEDVYSTLSYLYEKRHGVRAPIRNVPNKYLRDERIFPPRT